MKKLIPLLLFFTGCTSMQPLQEHKSGHVTFLFQSNRLGSITPNSCHSNPFGGIDREYAAIAKYDKQSTLILDAGNTFGPSERKSLAYFQKRAETLVPLLNTLGTEVIAIGPNDLWLGYETISKLMTKSKATFVASNVRSKKNSVSFSRVFTVVKDGIKIGILALTPTSAAHSDWEIDEPEAVINELLPGLSKDHDFVVLLSQLGNSVDMTFAQKYPQIGLIIGSDPLLATERPLWFQGHTIVADVDRHGSLLGRLEIQFQFPFKGLYSYSDIASNQLRLKQYQESAIAKYKNYIEYLQETTQLTAPEGASLYEYELVKLDETRFGKPNRLTQMAAEVTQKRHQLLEKLEREPRLSE